MAKASIGMTVINDNDVIDLLKKLDQAVRFKVADKAIRQAATPVRKRIQELAPDSKRTQSRDKQSRKTRAKWQNSRSLKTTIKTVVRRHPMGAKAFVGPSYSDGGGHGNFFSRDHKRAKYWGRDPILSARRVRVVNRFVKKAADETAASAKSIAVRVLTSALKDPKGQGLLR